MIVLCHTQWIHNESFIIMIYRTLNKMRHFWNIVNREK
jgi:hypothetical protein